MTYILSEYDSNLKNIHDNGWTVFNKRTGMNIKTLLGLHTRIDISERVPILTKRKVAWQSIIKEVLWYISGSHKISDLESLGSHIWSPWKNNEFTQRHNLPDSSAGYIYGYNLIHFGDDIQKQTGGFNQLDYVINTLREDPTSRQACFTFWRPDKLEESILPACHAFYSFVITPNDKKELSVLNCHVFQRSNDYPIGVGMGNLLTATIFVRLLCLELELSPGQIIHSGSHCHIYENAFGATKTYLEREDAPSSPVLHITKKQSIYDYSIDDFKLEEYNPLPAIKFPIAV